jgi:hypothetical protein
MYKIAGQAGIHPTTLSAYSLGYAPIPPLHLMLLSEVLGVPEEELVGEPDFGLPRGPHVPEPVSALTRGADGSGYQHLLPPSSPI